MSRVARFESRIASDLERIESRDLKPILKVKSKALTAIRTVSGLAVRIVRFEIVANQRRLESLRTANRDSRHLRSKGKGHLSAKVWWVRRGCQASQRKGLTSGEVRETSGKVWGTSGEVWETSGEPPCPSSPWLFCFYQGKPQICQGFSSPAEPPRTLEKTGKTPK